MTGPRLYLFVAAIVVTALVLFSIIANAEGRSIIDGRSFIALTAGGITLWTAFTITTCTRLILLTLFEQDNVRSSRVRAVMDSNGLVDIDDRRRARADSN